MKRYLLSILLLLLTYLSGFFHGTNSSIVNEKIRKVECEKDNTNFDNLVTNTFGIILIESIANDKDSAETDFIIKSNIAKYNHWTLVGDKKTVEMQNKYKIYQTAMRFQD